MGTSKLQDIKETASDAVAILRELGTPGVQETLDKVRDTTMVVKEIMETLKTPEWTQNIDNIRRVVEEMNSSSARMDNTVKQLRESGIIDEAKDLVRSTKNTMDSFNAKGGAGGQELREMGMAFKEMLESIRLLMDELRATTVELKKSNTLNKIEQAVTDASNTYKAVKRGVS